jgi:ferrochelatase
VKTGVLFVNFGGPTQDDELEPFLFQLLSDVLPGPEMVRKLAARFIARRRSEFVRPIYRSIGWSPLVEDSRAQAAAAMEGVDGDLPWALGMMFSEPSMEVGLRGLLDCGVERLLVVGLFPHYSFATAGSAYNLVHKALVRLGQADMAVHYAKAFYNEPAYHEALAATVQEAAPQLTGEGPVHLLFSAHGLPLSFLRKGDPYPEHVRQSIRQTVRLLRWTDPWHLAWQSRLGPAKWLSPSMPTTLDELAATGAQRVLIVPVSFVGEHIETLDEIDREYRDHAVNAGIPHFGRARAVGMQPRFIQCLTDQVTGALSRFDAYSCARCLLPKPDAHRRQARCGNCRFVFPAYLREGR